MQSIVLDPIRRSTLLQKAELTAALAYAIVFAALLAYERPGLGMGQGFYVAIVLLALTGGPMTGVVAGILATTLYVTALLLTGQVAAADVVKPPVEIRLGAYLLAGLAVGYFAQRGRRILAASLRVIDDLVLIARRDVATETLDRLGLLAALERGTARSAPFTLLVGDIASGDSDGQAPEILSDDDFPLLARSVADAFGRDVDIARVSASRFAVAGSFGTTVDSRSHAETLEAQLPSAGYHATVGWASYPHEGSDALSLFMAATERLYARLLERKPADPPASE